MKTNRIILAAILALTVVSCTTEREDEVNPAAPAAAKADLKPLKVEKVNNNNQGSSTAREGDSTVVYQQTTTTQPITIADPNDPELIPPGDVKPPKGGK